jgi:putative transposase
MSNHVHLLIDLYVQIEDIPSSIEITEKNYKPLYDIVKLIKGGSAFEINKVLKRKGKFWQVEYYDHYVRDKREFLNIIYYIANNPVKAGIVKNWKDYQFTYVKEEYKINLP